MYSNEKVKVLKEKYAELFDLMVEHVLDAQKEMDAEPSITSPETIRKHMEVIKRGEEAQRCMSEACRFLEVSMGWAEKGITPW